MRLQMLKGLKVSSNSGNGGMDGGGSSSSVSGGGRRIRERHPAKDSARGAAAGVGVDAGKGRGGWRD